MKKELIKLIKENISKESGVWISVPIEDYVNKIYTNSTIIPYIVNGCLMGFISYYNNDISKENSFLTMILISKDFQGKGVGKMLLDISIRDLEKKGFLYYSLEVFKTNTKAIELYSNYGFLKNEDRGDLWLMKKMLK